jgi:hypothetical protein
VATAFGLRELGFFAWHENPVWRYRAVVIPHPSGRNHWYNAPENMEVARRWWREYLEEKGAWWPPDVVDGVHRFRPRGICRTSPDETPSLSCEASR